MKLFVGPIIFKKQLKKLKTKYALHKQIKYFFGIKFCILLNNYFNLIILILLHLFRIYTTYIT